MDLLYNEQYRMIELNSFFVVRNIINGSMLVPGIIEKVYQLQVKYNINPTIIYAKGEILTI